MDFSVFFKNHLYLFFGIFLYVIYNSGRHKNYSSRIIVIYLLILFLILIKNLRLIYMLIIFLIVSFLQFEFLTDDKFKLKVVSGFFSKLFDCMYLLFFKYNFLLYTLSIYFIWKANLLPLSEINIKYFKKLNLSSTIYLVLGAIIFIRSLIGISNSKFELNTFDEIKSKLKPEKFETFNNIDITKLRILTEIEDKTFFYRNISYNFISWWVILFKIRTMIDIILEHRYLKINQHKKPTIREKFASLKRFIKGQKRGNSTLEMQLYRQVAVKEGYNRKYIRKISEIIYSQILFSGLKKYLKKDYQIVSNKRYKEFLVDRYIRNAPSFVEGGNRKYFDSLFNSSNINSITNGKFLLFVLSLSKKLNRKDILKDGYIDFDLFKGRYIEYIFKYSITDEELKEAIEYFNNQKKQYII